MTFYHQILVVLRLTQALAHMHTKLTFALSLIFLLLIPIDCVINILETVPDSFIVGVALLHLIFQPLHFITCNTLRGRHYEDVKCLGFVPFLAELCQNIESFLTTRDIQ